MKSLIKALLALLLLNTVSNAETVVAKPITRLPATITASGNYRFTKNLVFTRTDVPAITISANNVAIDLNGFSLTGPNTASVEKDGIYSVGTTNLTIRNGTITGFFNGVQIAFCDSVNISEMRLVGNFYRGITMSGTNNVIRGNRILRIGGSSSLNSTTNAAGIEVSGSNYTIAENEIDEITPTTTQAGAYGIYISNASRVMIESNRIRYLTANMGGVSIGMNIDVSSDVLAVDNRLLNMTSGIFYFDSTGKYSGNLTNSVTVPFQVGGTSSVTAVGTND